MARSKGGARRLKGLSPIQRKVYDYIKVVEGPGEIDQDALAQVDAMGERGAQAYWKVQLEPYAREAAGAARAFVGGARKKNARKKNPVDAKAILRRAMRGT